jgi:hypothetical protein
MDNQTYLDFLTSVGESFCECFVDEPDFEDSCPHDFQEVLWEAIGDPLTPEMLSSATTEENLNKIIECCKNFFETDSVSKTKLVQAIEMAMTRW